MFTSIKTKVFNPLAKMASEATEATTDFITDNVDSLKQLVSLESHDRQEDVTHYFLIPDLHEQGEYILQTHRIVPSNPTLKGKIIQR